MGGIAHFKVKRFFYALPETLYSQDEDEKYDLDHWTYIKAFVGSFVVPMSLAAVTLLLQHEDNESALYTSKAWLERMKHSGCDSDQLDPAAILHYWHFEYSSILAVGTGSLIGQFLEH